MYGHEKPLILFDGVIFRVETTKNLGFVDNALATVVFSRARTALIVLINNEILTQRLATTRDRNGACLSSILWHDAKNCCYIKRSDEIHDVFQTFET